MFHVEVIEAFNEAEVVIYQFVIQNKHLIPYMTVREFAAQVHSSPPSILRFCRKVGYAGFSEFKKECKKEFEKENELGDIKDMRLIFRDFIAKVNTKEYQQNLHDAAVMLSKADRILCAGYGAAGSIAYYAAMYFTAVGKFANYIDGRLINALHKTTKDLYILFCVSGESESMINLIRKVKENGGESMVITNSRYSTMARLSDMVLPYDIYYTNKNQFKAMTTEEALEFEMLMDNEATQLPTAYLIETLGKMIFTSI